MKSDFLVALTQLAAERNLPRDKVMSAIEAALISAFKRDTVTEGRNISVKLDPGSGDIEVDIIKTVVETVEDPLVEITLEDAKKSYKSEAIIGDIIPTEKIPNSAGRIAAQTAKQVVLQRLREAEREIILSEYEGKEGEILTCSIQRIEPTKIVLDTGRTEAILPISHQVPSERYRQGSKLRVLLQNIDKESAKGPELIVSRTDELLLRRLFEQEVPEIHSGAVEIIGIARESGSRSKIAVRARQDGVDPVGSCVGLRGVRIQSIVNELQGEKIDILEWNKDINKYISNALSPSQVHRVDIDKTDGTATAIVPDRHLSLAIGKDGQNARLAAKLAGCKVDIKSDMQVDISKLPDVDAEESETSEQKIPVELTNDEIIEIVSSQIKQPENVTANVPEPATTSSEEPDEDELLKRLLAEEQETADHGSDTTESLESSLSAEEELLLLEEMEDSPTQQEKENDGADLSDVPEDIWSIHRAGLGQDQKGVIRFAEDIEDLGGGVTARKGRRNTTQPNSSRNKRGKGSRKR